jgi:hypothetical protein
MSFKYFVKERVGKGMMVQTLLDGILKVNHSLFDELFKGKKNTHVLGAIKDCKLL